MPDLPRGSSPRRARRSFWTLLLVAVLASGSLSAALASDPGHLVGLRVGVSGVVLIASIILAARVMGSLERARRQANTLPEHHLRRRARRMDSSEEPT